MARAAAIADIEEIPEPDRLLDFPHPRETVQLFGQGEAERQFLESFASGRLHHAWLLTGLAGIGKAAFAYRIARFLLADPTERDPFGSSLEIDAEAAASRQVRAQSHPGLLVIRRPYDHKTKRHRTEIIVDEVRRTKSFLNLTADEDAWRAVIVDPADEMNANAANALLKSLEEPPARTVFLLVSSAPGRLLPTIRSRCRTLALASLKGEELKRAVQQAIAQSGEVSANAVPDPGEWPLLERLSEGSVRTVLALKTSGGLELYGKLHKAMLALPKTDWASAHSLGDELASQAAEHRFELFFDLLLGLVARLVRAQAAGTANGEDGELANRLIGDERLAVWATLWETIAAEKAQALALNLDRKSLILETFSRLERAARG